MAGFITHPSYLIPHPSPPPPPPTEKMEVLRLRSVPPAPARNSAQNDRSFTNRRSRKAAPSQLLCSAGLRAESSPSAAKILRRFCAADSSGFPAVSSGRFPCTGRVCHFAAESKRRKAGEALTSARSRPLLALRRELRRRDYELHRLRRDIRTADSEQRPPHFPRMLGQWWNIRALPIARLVASGIA